MFLHTMASADAPNDIILLQQPIISHYKFFKSFTFQHRFDKAVNSPSLDSN